MASWLRNEIGTETSASGSWLLRSHLVAFLHVAGSGGGREVGEGGALADLRA